MLNWYKVSQNLILPDTIELLSEAEMAWISPQGIIYSTDDFPIHSEWVRERIPILRENFGLDLNPEDDRYLLSEKLVQLNWIRFIKKNIVYVFEVKDLKDFSILKIIEQKLFDDLGTDNKQILICGSLSKLGCSEFYWKDFLGSGENFIDFVQANKD